VCAGAAGDMRIQFRTGSSLDSHVFARNSGSAEVDTRNAAGEPL
jgi:hypothetical protein